MTLRKNVEEAISSAMKENPVDAKAVALAACAAVEWEVELGGNGWWDGDEEFKKYSAPWRPGSGR